MRSVSIVIVTDRKDRAHVLVEAVSPLAACRIAGIEETWSDFDVIRGVIADLPIDQAAARNCLRMLSDRLGRKSIPLIYLRRTPGDVILREAGRLGATACFSALTEPTAVVAALFKQIAPEKSITDFLVERSVDRVQALFGNIFAIGRSRRINLAAIDDEVDPVLMAIREGGIQKWLDLVQAHDDATVRHCLHVAGLVANFAIHLGLAQSDGAAFVRAGLVHDVGKTRIPVEILNKPGPLDADEQAVMRRHAAFGHEILLASGMSDTLSLAATRHHHEMLDGSGYPDGLHGEQISDPVRLLTICDIYAALTEHRPYRAAMSQIEALQTLRGISGGKLESVLVEAFAASLADGSPSTALPARVRRAEHRTVRMSASSFEQHA